MEADKKIKIMSEVKQLRSEFKVAFICAMKQIWQVFAVNKAIDHA